MDGREIAVRIEFENLSRGEANRVAQELLRFLRDSAGDGIVASIERQDVEAQDAGSILAIVFGSSTAVAVAHGVRAYLARRSDPRDKITIRTKDGLEVIATGEAARTLDASALLRATRGPIKER